MSVRARLIILLAVLLVLGGAMLPVLVILGQGQTRHLQTYGWSDPVIISGPEAGPSPPRIAGAYTLGGSVVLAWESSEHEEPRVLVARSADYVTWHITDPDQNVAESCSQPALMVDSDGIVWLAWRGETKPSLPHETYTSGIFWGMSRDDAASWETPKPLVVFQAEVSDEVIDETIYSKPHIYGLERGVRIYYESNRDPASGWIWYQETVDNGATWSQPTPVPGSEPYDRLLLTERGSLITLRREDAGSISLTVRDENHQVVAQHRIGHGWPSYLGQDTSGKIWALWHRTTGEHAKQRYVLENGTVVESAYVRHDIWLSTSIDEGLTWSEPARLGTGERNEKSGIIIQDPEGGYLALYATYPVSETSPWEEAWRWFIAAKHAPTMQMARVRTIPR